jgi:hypothetical protein
VFKVRFSLFFYIENRRIPSSLELPTWKNIIIIIIIIIIIAAAAAAGDKLVSEKLRVFDL